MESATGYRFYFDVQHASQITVNTTANAEPLDRVLTKALQATGLKFSIDREHHVFITSRYQVITTLAAGYYKENRGNIMVIDEEAVPDFTAETKKPETKVSEKVVVIGEKKVRNKPHAIISGYVKSEKSGEPVINASVFIEKLQRGTVTDQYGHYLLTVPTGEHIFSIQSLGMQDQKLKVIIYSDGRMDVELKDAVATLKEVVVSAQKVANVTRVQMGLEKLNIATIKKVPALFGEADVIKAVLTLPGVKSVGEASAGFNVRGGSTDQNLILLNDGTIYNPSHFFGMFSAFNPEIIKDIELYKSSIPVKFGGRLSSVLNITTREGNKKEFTGLAGVGVITSRFNIEGPLVKNRTSFIFGARTTYANWLLKLLPDPYDRSKASFSDLNLGISHHINDQNDIYASGYYSTDQFNLASDTTYAYSNRSANLKWKHSFGNKLTGYFTTGFDQYEYHVTSKKNKINAYRLAFDVTQFNLKADFTHTLNARHTLDYGLNAVYYKLNPGSFTPVGTGSLVKDDIVSREQALESALYLGDRYNISQQLSVNAGIRYAIFNYLGPQDVNLYAAGVPKTETSITGTKHYNGGVIQTYQAPEYRLSVRYAFNNTFSVKAGYNSSRQYIHMLSNTTSIAPTDIWKLSDPNIKPQQGDQVSLGFYKNLKSNTIELSAEFYYKRLKNYLDYKPGATLVLNHHIETDVIQAAGKAYGAELMLKKPGGKLNGWISYTYSRILLKMDDPTISELINGGKYYPANYDKPHDVTLVGNYKVNHRLSFSANVTYSTGRPITLPIGRYYYAGSERVLYSDRNAYRIPDYFRADVAMNIEGNHKVKQKTHNSWTIGLYNITGRKNPYSVYFVSQNGFVRGYKLSIFGSILPFINYNIRF
ncbi:MAG TPA: TonB-dependent receptor [Chitinophagaceae bacterium]